MFTAGRNNKPTHILDEARRIASRSEKALLNVSPRPISKAAEKVSL
jgi:hypothetical protein